MPLFTTLVTMKTLTSLFALLFTVGITAQTINSNQLDGLAAKYAKGSFDLYKELLSLPNDAAGDPADIEANVQWCELEFGKRGFTTQRIETPGPPLLLAERKAEGASKTVLIYLQLDGQPVDPSRWDQDDPWTPVLKVEKHPGRWEEIPWEKINNYEDDWRVFARAASDAKGPVAMFLAAMDALKEVTVSPNFNMKVIMDFEEELGSPNLPQAVKDNTELLSADMLIIFDGPMHRSNKPTLTFGARGISTIDLVTYGPVVPQHSGHFGNYVPNPAFRLSQLLSSMKDDEGRVTIPGFYDGITIDEGTHKVLKAVPHDEEQLLDILQLGSVDKVGSYYQEAIQYPSLNIRGMQSGWIDEKVRTIIPAWAKAEIDVRLVLESDPERLMALIKKHVEDQGYYVTDREPTKEERMAHEKVASFYI